MNKKQKQFIDEIYEKYFNKNPNAGERNIIPEPMEYSDFVDIIKRYFLGDDWFVSLSMNDKQATTLIAIAIIEGYTANEKK